MTTAKHTPWHTSTRIAPRPGFWIKRAPVNGHSTAVCAVDDEAEARLIAAAPELLNALELAQATLDRLQPQRSSTQGTHDVIAAAIAKATTP